MSNQVAPMQSIADTVKDRIKGMFADMIPDDVYETLVKTALQEFVSKELPGIVKEKAREHLIEIVKVELNKPEWYASVWNGSGQQLASDMIAKLLKEHSAEIVNGMMGHVVMMMVQSLRNNRMY